LKTGKHLQFNTDYQLYIVLLIHSD